MTRILLCGLAPLPFENSRKSFGPGIRTWQMARALADAGHQVHLLAMCIEGAYDDEPVRREEVGGVSVERLDARDFLGIEAIGRRHGELLPDAVVGATVYGSHVLARIYPRVPFWADQFGHVMAEAQAKARLDGDNACLAHFWSLLRPVMQRADRVSVVSTRQRWAAVGELGALGRLTAESCGTELVEVIPCGWIPPKREAPPEPILRGQGFPEDAFVVFWSGGYNVWSDARTLFRAVERAMERDRRVHFVSTGGEIGGHDESTYRGFQEAVASSPHRDRYHLLGWVRADDVPRHTAEADLGVLCELPMYEGRLGSKNRIVQWMGAGLPVAYNAVGDLGDLLGRHDLGLVFPPGDAAAMAERILWAAGHPRELEETARRARRYCREELSFAATCRPLVEWAADPLHAPDVGYRDRIASPADFAVPDPDPDTEGRRAEPVGEAGERSAAGLPGRLVRRLRRLPGRLLACLGQALHRG